MGRPRKFKNIEDLQAKIDDYFDCRDKEGKPYTITSLALHLDTSREGLLNIEKYYPKEFFDSLKKARLKCQSYAEDYLYGGKNVVGAIFNLKNNYNWQDKSSIDAKTDSTLEIKIKKY